MRKVRFPSFAALNNWGTFSINLGVKVVISFVYFIILNVSKVHIFIFVFTLDA